MTEYRYKWVRAEIRGAPDTTHVQRHEAEGWEKVPPDELPTHLSPPKPVSTVSWKTPNTLDPGAYNEIGGLALYRLPEERALLRAEYYRGVTEAQSTAAAEHYLRDNAYAPMKKFAEMRTAPQENPKEFIAALPETLTDEDAENIQCFIEDFLLPNINYYPESIAQINELRVRIRRRPYELVDLIEFSKRSWATQRAYDIRREDDAKAIAVLAEKAKGD